jgi:hypothetical protein
MLRARHIVTLESPIEYIFNNRQSFIRQREIPTELRPALLPEKSNKEPQRHRAREFFRPRATRPSRARPRSSPPPRSRRPQWIAGLSTFAAGGACLTMPPPIPR